jgi:hypothetical protein
VGSVLKPEVVIVWLLFGFLTAFVASWKHRNVGLWAVLGFAFGVFALVVVAIMRTKKPAYYG